MLLRTFSKARSVVPVGRRRLISTSRPSVSHVLLQRSSLAAAATAVSTDNSLQSSRTFASYAAAPHGINRTFPQYSIYGENSMLGVKIIMPKFRLVRGESLVVDQSSKGRILLEFTPRGSDGIYGWSDQIRFGLSAEEVGLLINQLPQYSVELSRAPPASSGGGGDEMRYGEVSNSELPDKVLKAESGDGGTVLFSIDYVKDGIGGQLPGPGQEGKAGPIDVIVQAGEFEVMTTIMRTSIPYLVGWTNLMDISMQHAVAVCMNSQGNYGGGNFGGGPQFSSGGPGAGGAPS